MPLLSANTSKIAKPLAEFSRLAAKKPFQVILFTLILTSIAYLHDIEYYVNGWNIDNKPLFSNTQSNFNLNSHSIFDSKSFFYDSSLKTFKELSDISTAETEKNGQPKNYFSTIPNYYLTELQFQLDSTTDRKTQNGGSALPHIDDVVYETGNSKFVLQSTFQLPDEVVNDDSSKKWKLRPQKKKLLQIKQWATNLYALFEEKLHQSDPVDLFVLGSAYIGMIYTFVKLFMDMRKTGSKLWMAVFSLVNSGCALFLAIYLSLHILEKPVTLLSLIEGIPFIVIIIGFKHKVKLAEFTLKQYSQSGFGNKRNVPSIMVNHAMQQEGGRLIQDYFICIFSFLACALFTQHLSILHNFSVLAAMILTLDLILTSTFFCSVLSLKLEINMIHRSTTIEQALEEDGILDQTAGIVAEQDLISENASFFTSNTIITFFKLLITVAFVGLNFYNFAYRWTYESFTSIYKSDSNGSSLGMPGHTAKEYYQVLQILKSTVFDKDCIVSIIPTQYYEKTKLLYHVEDYVILIIHYISLAIRDKFISKFVFLCFCISVSINIYLLNTARIHTSITVKKYITKKNNKKLSSSSSANKAINSEKTKPVSVTTTNKTTTTAISSLNKSTVSQIQEKPKLLKKSSSSSSLETFDPIYELEDVEDEIVRPLGDLENLMKSGQLRSLNNQEVVSLVTNGKLPLYALEKQLADTTRAVVVRRKALSKLANAPVLETEVLPYKYYDYDRVFGACCENVIGFMPLPVGIIGPLVIDGVSYHIPMATTEGCLVASAMRGCKAINSGGGVVTVLTKDGMTRGPCVRFPSLQRSGACKIWLDSEEGQAKIKKAFNSTSRFARLQHIQTALAGDLLFVRFRTTTGDAMGMNMISKGVEYSLKMMIEEFGWDDMEIVSVSGNYCMDKKPGAINWIEGRGKSVVAQAIIPKLTVEKVLKSDVKALVELNISKNLIGSAMAGSVGGFNAHAANLVTAVYLALGQDPAQNVESSNCITLMKETENGDLQISVSMPSIEVGTIGGGTILGPQGSMLDLLGIRGPHPTSPGSNARQLAKIVACAVLAGELSLCSALAAGHLVQSHMIHNRAKAPPSAPVESGKPVGKTPEQLENLKKGSVTCIKS
ncbi:hypothetical protein ACO0QE_001810 [Hanseniaspora vineae]